MSEDRLRVAFDVTPVISGRTGIARYVNQIGAAVEGCGVELRKFAIGRSSFPAPADTRHLPIPARLVERWWQSVPWPGVERLVGGANVVHATGPLLPATRCPLVITVHDVAAMRYPELHPSRHVQQQRAAVHALQRAAVILAVSRTTADDLVHLGIASERIVVAPLGLTPLPEPMPAPAGEPAAGSYLLTVGETAPRKGYGVVLEALALVDHDVDLVMAGPPADDEQRLRLLAAELGVARRLTRLGAVTDSTLSGLYRGAVALCFPSVAEGFGLPVLEAMAAGAPVLVSDIPATRELAGDAAVYVSRSSKEAWAQAIDAIVSDAGLRNRHAEAGRRRAAEFTWERTATATIDAYRLALGAAP